MNTVPTLDEINNMTDEEVAKTNRVLAKRLLKRIAIGAAVTIAAIVVADRIDRQSKIDQSEIDS